MSTSIDLAKSPFIESQQLLQAERNFTAKSAANFFAYRGSNH